jgi:hypothetical protein
LGPEPETQVFEDAFITDYSDPAVFTNALTAAKPGVVDRAQAWCSATPTV